jgi:tripartite-type tricarboxylate transporter receptor subunit TctC
MRKHLMKAAAIFAVTVSTCAATAADAQSSVANFYKGKTIALVIGADAGGGSDTYGRLVARYLSKYLPGNPAVIPQNMPGAVSSKAAAYLYTQAPRDGTTIGAIDSSVVLKPLFAAGALPFDPSKFIYLGSANSDNYLCIVRSDAPVKTFKETFAKEVVLGATTEGAKVYDLPVMLDNVLGTKLRIVRGYPGTNQISLAIENKEVEGMCGLSWATLGSQHPDWISSGFVRILVQEGVKGLPQMDAMGVPLTVNFARTDEDRQVMELFYSQGEFGRPFVIPPGVPAERVAALRTAFMAVLHDKEALADAAREGLDIDALPGADFQGLVAKLYALPAKVIERAKKSLVYTPPS